MMVRGGNSSGSGSNLMQIRYWGYDGDESRQGDICSGFITPSADWPPTAILSNVQQGIQEPAIMDFDIAPLYW